MEARKDIFRQNMRWNDLYFNDVASLQIWIEFTFRFIHSHNRKHLPYTLASNHMADMTNEEMGVMRGRLRSTGYNGGLPFAYSTGELKSVPKSLGKLLKIPHLQSNENSIVYTPRTAL